MMDLSTFVEEFRCLDTRGKKYIVHPIDTRWSPEKESHCILRDTIDITIDRSLCLRGDKYPRKSQENKKNEYEEKELFQGK